jgi:hypothetical protein
MSSPSDPVPKRSSERTSTTRSGTEGSESYSLGKRATLVSQLVPRSSEVFLAYQLVKKKNTRVLRCLARLTRSISWDFVELTPTLRAFAHVSTFRNPVEETGGATEGSSLLTQPNGALLRVGNAFLRASEAQFQGNKASNFLPLQARRPPFEAA